MMDATQDQLSSDHLVTTRRRFFCCTCRGFWLWCAGMAAILLIAAAGFYSYETADQVPRYSVAIDSVSGLYPAINLGHMPTLDPLFNLTFRVASEGLWVTRCTEPGMHVEVSYSGVLVASSTNITENICAGPRNSTDLAIDARGIAVPVSGSVMKSLAADMHRREQVFDVMLRGPDEYTLWSCGRIRVGDAGSLRKECTGS